MARVEIATEAWGYIVSTNGRPMAGQLAAIDTTVYAAATGGATIAPAAFISNAEGLLPGWLEPGRYTFTEPDGDSRTVVAGGGYQTMMDENSTMAKRDTLRFEGSAVELQDDSANDRTRVIVTGSPGAAGPPGEIFGVDVWNEEASPGSVTDWGPTINTLISGGAKLLLFRDEDFPFSTTIDITADNVVFKGMAGDHWFSPTAGVTRLKWTGTGAGNAVDFNGTDINRRTGVRFEDIGWVYTSQSYTGTYFAASLATKFTARNCYFGAGEGFSAGSIADLGFDLGNGIRHTFEECTFQGFAIEVQGFDNSATTYCNGVTFRDCVFQGYTDYSVVNPSDQWVFDGCIFEGVGFGGHTVLRHISIEATGSFDPIVTMRDCTNWDSDTPTVTRWVYQAPSVSSTLLVLGGTEHSSLTKSMELDGNGSVCIVGAGIGIVDFGDGTDNTHKKRSVVLLGGGSADTPLNLNKGHQNVFVAAFYDFDHDTTGGMTGFLNHTIMEAADNREYTPTVTVSAGAPSGTQLFAASGNDRAGRLELRNNSGGANLAAGTVFDVVAEFPYVPPNSGGTVRPKVMLTPKNANAVAAGGYVPDPSAVGTWKLAIANATLANGDTAAWDYLVTYGQA